MRKPILELDDGKKWQMYSAYQDIADQKAERGDIKETPEHWIQAPTPLPPCTHPLPAPASRTLATQPRCRPATLPPSHARFLGTASLHHHHCPSAVLAALDAPAPPAPPRATLATLAALALAAPATTNPAPALRVCRCSTSSRHETTSRSSP